VTFEDEAGLAAYGPHPAHERLKATMGSLVTDVMVIDFWPGEYSKTYVYAAKSHDDILGGLRSGRVFVTLGDLVSAMQLNVTNGDNTATIGGDLETRRGETITIEIRVTDPDTTNANGDNPRVNRVDLITGDITGRARDQSHDRNPSTRVLKRFDDRDWRRDGNELVMTHTLEPDGPMYFRVRGTNTDQLEPEPDQLGEDPWRDLWFYSNPVFVVIE